MLDTSHLIYASLGAVAFAVLGIIATYYRDDTPSKKSVARDFVAGSLIVSFAMLLMPAMFPAVNMSIPLPDVTDVISRGELFATKSGGSGSGSGKDYDLQLHY
jgi:hypothetical protein